MKLLIPLVLCLFFVSEQAWALRCGNKLVNVGDRKHKVHRVCGEPTYVDAYDLPIPNFGYAQGYNRIDVWTYNFGPRRFMRELVFENGILRRINQLEYGY